MQDFARFQDVQQLLTGNPVKRRTLEVLKREISASGWSIAKVLNQDPETMGQVLNELRGGGLIDSENGSGLDGFYFLTGLAYQVMSSAVS